MKGFKKIGSILKHQIIPPVFLLFFLNVVQFLSITAQGRHFTIHEATINILGNKFSWIFVAVLWIWGFASLKVPSSVVLGPETPFGFRPEYKDNGFGYYWVSLAAFLGLQLVYPCYEQIYDNMPQILSVMNHTALLLCVFLLIKGKVSRDHEKDVMAPRPLLFEFYRGLELHPRMLGIDVKQMTNCRVGLLAWQLLITAFYLTSVERNGFNGATLLNFLLQTIYLVKFYWWEAGYFYTLDMMLDRAGWYLCWGCLVWVPCLYTFSSYYIVAQVPVLSTSATIIWSVVGFLSLLLNYLVDYEKQIFRHSGYQYYLCGDKATYILATYKDNTGQEKKTALLTSGFWGLARHLNYTFELTCGLAWCIPGYGYGMWTFLYFYFLLFLLIHRTFRDEDKCSKKYGKYWDKYCQQVPYRIIPYIW